MSATFNPHRNVTADGIVIAPGLVVWTNDMESGTVIEDQHANQYQCCLCSSTDPLEESVIAEHPRAQRRVNGGWFTDHAAVCPTGHPGCRHDHWFTVSTARGTVSMNGERMATVFEGRRP